MNLEKPIFRAYQPADYPQLKLLMQASYAELVDAYATEAEMEAMWLLYPQGQIVCELGGKLIGANICRVAPLERYSQPHTQADVSNLAHYLPDTIAGDCVSAVDAFVDPAYHNLKIGQKLVELFVSAVFSDNFKAMIGVSRLVNYHQHKQLDINSYVQKVCDKEIYDQVLSFHLRNGMRTQRIVPNFNPEDSLSLGYGLIVSYPNPNFDPNKPIYPAREQNLLNFQQYLPKKS